MKDITLELGITIPLEKYMPMRVAASITEDKKEGETDEQLFNRAIDSLEASFEAYAAIMAQRFLQINEEMGLLAYARGLAEEMSISENNFVKSYLEKIKESETKANLLTKKEKNQ